MHKKKKKKKKKKTKQTNKASKLDWLKPHHKSCKRLEKRRNHLESFPSRWETWMEILSFAWTFVQMDKKESWNH